MSDTMTFFNSWAPYWSYLEDNYLTLRVSISLPPSLNPLYSLLGQGIIVEQLLNMGFKADGIELSPQMIEFAKQRRGLDFIQADARNIPNFCPKTPEYDIRQGTQLAGGFSIRLGLRESPRHDPWRERPLPGLDILVVSNGNRHNRNAQN